MSGLLGVVAFAAAEADLLSRGCVCLIASSLREVYVKLIIIVNYENEIFQQIMIT